MDRRCERLLILGRVRKRLLGVQRERRLLRPVIARLQFFGFERLIT